MARIHFEICDKETGNVKKEFNIQIPDVKKLAVGAYIFGSCSVVFNKIRPPRRNIGLLLNLYVAGIATKALMGLIFREDEEKECCCNKECDCEKYNCYHPEEDFEDEDV